MPIKRLIGKMRSSANLSSYPTIQPSDGESIKPKRCSRPVSAPVRFCDSCIANSVLGETIAGVAVIIDAVLLAQSLESDASEGGVLKQLEEDFTYSVASQPQPSRPK